MGGCLVKSESSITLHNEVNLDYPHLERITKPGIQSQVLNQDEINPLLATKLTEQQLDQDEELITSNIEVEIKLTLENGKQLNDSLITVRQNRFLQDFENVVKTKIMEIQNLQMEEIKIKESEWHKQQLVANDSFNQNGHQTTNLQQSNSFSSGVQNQSQALETSLIDQTKIQYKYSPSTGFEKCISSYYINEGQTKKIVQKKGILKLTGSLKSAKSSSLFKTNKKSTLIKKVHFFNTTNFAISQFSQDPRKKQ